MILGISKVLAIFNKVLAILNIDFTSMDMYCQYKLKKYIYNQ